LTLPNQKPDYYLRAGKIADMVESATKEFSLYQISIKPFQLAVFPDIFLKTTNTISVSLG
jgi:hypothetical protein